MTRVEIDPARLPLMLAELRLPAIARLWPQLVERSDREGWPGARLLAVLAELEVAERARRRIERHLNEARLPPDKTLDNFDFNYVPTLSRARVMALAAGDAWLNKGSNVMLFGPPGSGKSHISAALGRALVENGYRVLFTRTTDIVQRLQAARQDSPSRAPSPSSNDTTCWCLTTCPMLAVTRPKHPYCSSSSASDTNADPC